MSLPIGCLSCSATPTIATLLIVEDKTAQHTATPAPLHCVLSSKSLSFFGPFFQGSQIALSSLSHNFLLCLFNFSPLRENFKAFIYFLQHSVTIKRHSTLRTGTEKDKKMFCFFVFLGGGQSLTYLMCYIVFGMFIKGAV